VPAGTVLYPIAIDMPQYTVTYKTGYATNDTIYTITDVEGTAVAVPADPTRTGYTFAGWDVGTVATIGTENVTITATWTANTYTITFDANGGEGDAMDNLDMTYDVEATLPEATFEKSGYKFNGWNTAADGTGFAISDAATVKNVGTTGTVTLYAQWSKKVVFQPEAETHACTTKCGICGGCLDAACTEAACAKKCIETKMVFTDVSSADWFAEPVKYVYHAGLMKGVSETSFAPQAATSRAMIVTVLWRLAGEPEAVVALPFTDVDANGYYYDALKWAYGAGIINGKTATTFAPNADVTRQELATMLWRYAKYMGVDVSVGEDTNILSYEDALSINEYAIPAIQWACGAGIMQGKGEGILDPVGNAKRCEFAKMLMAYIEG